MLRGGFRLQPSSPAEIQVTHIEQMPFCDRILKTRLPKPSKVALFASIRGQHATVRIKIKVHSRRSWRALRRAAAGCGGLRRAAAGCGEYAEADFFRCRCD